MWIILYALSAFLVCVIIGCAIFHAGDMRHGETYDT